MSTKSKKMRDKRAPHLRAGFKCHPRDAYAAVTQHRGFTEYIGFIDEAMDGGVYQGAGEFKEFCYEPTGLISLPLTFFNRICKRLHWWEMRDDIENIAYRITFEEALEEGEEYETVHGPRWGVHVSKFVRIDGDGRVIYEPDHSLRS